MFTLRLNNSARSALDMSLASYCIIESMSLERELKVRSRYIS
jgi:hypothetical protein